MRGFLASVLYLAAVTSAASTATVGANLLELVPGDQNAWPFADLLAHAGPWVCRRLDKGKGVWVWESNAKMTLGPTGWPASFNPSSATDVLSAEAQVGPSAAAAASLLAGTYQLFWAGNGTVSLEGGAVNASFTSTSPTTSTATVSLVPSASGFTLRLWKLDASNPLRDVKLIPVELLTAGDATGASAPLFHPRFVSLLSASPATGVLRFGGWQRELFGVTYEPYSNVQEWEQRAVPGVFPEATRRAGVPLEHMTALLRAVASSGAASGAGRAGWFALPQGATPAYCRNFTRFLVTELIDTPGFTGNILIEFSNELAFYSSASVSATALKQTLAMKAELLVLARERAGGASASAIAVLAAFAPLRARFTFVFPFGSPYFVSNAVALMAAAQAEAGLAYTHPMEPWDAVSISGALGTAPYLSWGDPSWDVREGLQATDASLLTRLRRAALDADADFVRFANEVALWAAGNWSTTPAQPLAKRHQLLMTHAGLSLNAAVFGARDTLAKVPAVNRTAAGIAAAAREQAWSDKLANLVRHPAVTGLVADALVRAAAAGFTVLAGPDLLRPAISTPFGLGLRKAGNNGAAEGYPAFAANASTAALGTSAFASALEAAVAPGAAPPALMPVPAYAEYPPWTQVEANELPPVFTPPPAPSSAQIAASAGVLDFAVGGASALQAGDATVTASLALGLVSSSPRLAGLVAGALALRDSTALAAYKSTAAAAAAAAPASNTRGYLAFSGANPLAYVPELAEVAASGVHQLSELAACPVAGCVYGTCFNRSCVCWAGASGADCSVLLPWRWRGGPAAGQPCSPPPFPAVPPPDAASPPAPLDIGMNIGGLADYSTQLTYVDVARQSRAFISQSGGLTSLGWSFGTPPNELTGEGTTAGGYPAVLPPGLAVGTMMLRDLNGHYPPGVYAVTWEGDGTLDFSMDDVREVQRVAAGVVLLRVSPTTGLNNGIFLRIIRSNPSDPVRNVRVTMPGYAATAASFPFHPALLQALANFTTLRFMDATNTNDELGIVEWEARGLPSDRTATVKGMPWEDVALLANTLGSNLYISVPYSASESYISSLASLLYTKLRPDVNVTVEWANEAWGGLFPGGLYAQAAGTAMGLAADPIQARFCYVGNVTRRIASIFRSVWGSSSSARLRFVLNSQYVNADVTRRMLACGDAWKDVHAVAIAPYFSVPMTAGDSGKDSDLLSVGEVVKATLTSIRESMNSTLAQHWQAAAARGVGVMTYEVGQGFTPPSGAYIQVDFSIALNRNRPVMGALYAAYMAQLAASGVRTYNAFSFAGLPSRYGSWGHLEALDTDPASEAGLKFAVLSSYIAAHGACRPSLTPPPPAACPTGPVLSFAQARAAAAGSASGLAAAAAAPAEVCSGHGACVGSPIPGAPASRCHCYEGWMGPSCGLVKEVNVSTCPYRCNFRGTCALTRVEGYRNYYDCLCDPGYSGDSCSITSCPSHCSWNGRCVGSNKCQCYPGFAGADCSIDCGAQGHGRCAAALNASTPVTLLSSAVSSAPVAGNAAVCDTGYAFTPNGTVLTFNASGVVTALAGGTCEPVCACASPTQRCLRPGVCSCEPSCAYGDCVNGVCLCWKGYGGASCSRPLRPEVAIAAGAIPSRFSPAGMNLGGLAYWSTDLPFLNLMKSAGPWLSQYKEDWRPSGVYIWDRSILSPQNLSATGYPLSLLPDQALATLLARDIGQAFPNGRYIVKYDGEGDLFFGFDAKIVAQRKGRIELDVTFTTVRDNGIYMRVEDTNPANPLRNIRVLLPGTEHLEEDGVLFHPRFLANLANYSALRFMDWQPQTLPLGDVARTWESRTTPAHESWAGDVPVEAMVRLCNVLGVSPWFSMPTTATLDYVRRFASYVKDNLRPDVAVYIERGNEVWNALFDAGKANYAAAQAAGLMAPHLHAARSAEMFSVWEEVWGPAARASRLVHVLSTQTVNPWWTAQMLAYNNTWKSVDALGVTAYIDCGDLGSRFNAVRTAALTADRVLDLCASSIGPITYSWQEQIAAVEGVLAAARAADGGSVASRTPSPSPTPSPPGSPSPSPDPLLPELKLPIPPWQVGVTPLRPMPTEIPLVVYEGGPGLVESAAIERGSETPGLTRLLTSVNRHPRMEAVYRAYLDAFVKAGLIRTSVRGSRPADWYAFFHFSNVGRPTKYGSWGLLETALQPPATSPKSRALQGFIRDVIANRTRPGCTTRSALNYNPNALTPDGSCVFAPVSVTPAGGAVAFDAAPVTLQFQPGSLNTTTLITVAEVPLSSTLGSSSTAASSNSLWAGGGASSGCATNVSSNGTDVVCVTAPDASPSTVSSNSSAVVNATRLLATGVFDFGPDGTTFQNGVQACVTVNMSYIAEHGWGLSGDADASAPNSSLVLYHSQNGSDWTAAPSTFNETTGQLCGTLYHFTMVAGYRVTPAALQVDQTVAAALLPPSPSPTPSSSPTPSATASASGHAAPVGAVANADNGSNIGLIAGAAGGAGAAVLLALGAAAWAWKRRANANRKLTAAAVTPAQPQLAGVGGTSAAAASPDLDTFRKTNPVKVDSSATSGLHPPIVVRTD